MHDPSPIAVRHAERTTLPQTDNVGQSETPYRSLFENANDGIFIVSREGRYMAVNQKYAALTGLRKEEIIGQTIELFLPEQLTQSLERIEQIIKAGTFGPYEREVTTPLGKKTFSLNAFAYYEGGAPAGIMCIARDITEKHRQKELKALYQLAHDLARASNVRTMADYLFAQTRRLLGAEYGFLLLATADGSELKGTAACGIDLEAFQQERINLRREVAPVTLAFQQKQPVVILDMAHNPQVSERLRQQYSFLESIWVAPLMNGEEAIGVFAVGYAAPREATAAELRLLQLFSDETAMAVKRACLTEELRESEKRWQLALGGANDGIWDWNIQTNVVFYSPRTKALLGYEEHEVINQITEWTKRVHPEDLAGLTQALEAHLARQTPFYSAEYRVRSKDGSYKWILGRGKALWDEAGNVVRMAGSHTDITARKQAEMALRHAHDELEVRVQERTQELVTVNTALQLEIAEREQITEALGRAHTDLARKAAELADANAELSHYAYIASHDLRAPLRAIRNYTDFLQHDLAGTLTGDQNDYLAGLSEAVQECEALVDDLLHLSRIGSRALVFETLDLDTVLPELITALAFPPEVVVEWGTAWPRLETEPTLLRQILQNLILNGIKFNRSSCKHIALSWRPVGEKACELCVRDNGIGIEARYHEQIFHPFQRLHTSEEYEGTGIGLAIVKKAVIRLGGTLRVESTPGVGSAFFVTLPWTHVREQP